MKKEYALNLPVAEAVNVFDYNNLILLLLPSNWDAYYQVVSTDL